jgi:hypothetical protein
MANQPIPFGNGLLASVDRPEHINPPLGWPYIILPAEPVANDEPKAERRRLADNVVCMFDGERAPVVNMRWRGRYPRSVTRMYTGNRLYPGVYCVLWNPIDQRNHGCIVQLIERDRRRLDHWHARAVSRPIHVHWINEPANPEGHAESWNCLTSSSSLRRCASPER